MALAFKFRYEQFLRLKKKIEQDRAVELAAEQRILLQYRDILSDLQDRKLVHLMMESTLGGTSLQRIRAASEFLLGINEDIRRRLNLIKHQEKVVEDKRAILTEAVKERKIIEKIKERQFEAYTKENRRKELLTESETALQSSRRTA